MSLGNKKEVVRAELSSNKEYDCYARSMRNKNYYM